MIVNQFLKPSFSLARARSRKPEDRKKRRGQIGGCKTAIWWRRRGSDGETMAINGEQRGNEIRKKG